jgi:hypothetical protein
MFKLKPVRNQPWLMCILASLMGSCSALDELVATVDGANTRPILSITTFAKRPAVSYFDANRQDFYPVPDRLIQAFTIAKVANRTVSTSVTEVTTGKTLMALPEGNYVFESRYQSLDGVILAQGSSPVTLVLKENSKNLLIEVPVLPVIKRIEFVSPPTQIVGATEFRVAALGDAFKVDDLNQFDIRVTVPANFSVISGTNPERFTVVPSEAAPSGEVDISVSISPSGSASTNVIVKSFTARYVRGSRP